MSTTSAQFLERFFAGTECDIEIRPIRNNKPEKQIFTRDAATLARAIADSVARKANIYFGVATRRGKRGDKAHAAEVVAFWCDLDFKDVPEAEALARIAEFPVACSLLIHSGGGLHVYWFLTEPLDAHDVRVEPILKGIAKQLGADAACAEIARVLRVPGTKNFKPEYPEPRDVRIVGGDWERYEIGQFESFAAPTPSIISNGPLGLRIPTGVNLRDALKAKLNLQVRVKDGATYYDYHGLRGFHGAPQPCLVQGSVHKDYIDHPAECSFVEKDGLFWHACFDSDCQSKGSSNGVRGAEAMEPGDFASKTRIAVRRIGLEDVLLAPKPVIVTPAALTLIDMPNTVLDGRLGELCQNYLLKLSPVAYAWPALLAVAGTMTNQNSKLRSNLYVTLVGPVSTGKSATIENAMALFGLNEHSSEVESSMVGSAEGFFKNYGDANGCARLYFPDELKHLFEKIKIEGSSFASVLQRAYYHTTFEMVIAQGKKFQVNVSLAIAGGIANFEECYGSATTAGLYDRTLFGQCPYPFRYEYEPFEHNAARLDPVAVSVHPEVWAAKNEWFKTVPGMTGRVAENALRAASICAAFDGKTLLRAADLGPALEFAKYQIKFRDVKRPNPGENPEAICANAIVRKLEEWAPNGEWVQKRLIAKGIHSERFGPSIFRRAGDNLYFNEEIERKLIGTTKKAEHWRLRGENNE
jgi:hypothetical protein